MRYIAILLLALISSAPSFAQHSHGARGPSGGQMEDVAGVHAELVTAGHSIAFNILDEAGKPVRTNGFSGAVLVVNGSDRETVTLAPSGEHVLKGHAKGAVASGAAITLTIKTAEGKTGQAKFKK